MRKYGIWYVLLLKAHSKRRLYWIQTICVVFFLLLIATISLPAKSNFRVGVCNAKAEASSQLAKYLKEQDSIFEFISYEEEALMQKEILSGAIECGILFSEDFEERLQRRELRNSITYIATPFSTKGSVVRETVYAALFRLYSSEVLLESVDEIFRQPTEALKQELEKRNNGYIGSDEVFQIEIQTVDSKLEGKAKETQELYLLQGLFGLTIFLIMWLAYGKRFEGTEYNVGGALVKKERLWFEYLNLLAAATLPMLVGVLFISGLPESRGSIKELALGVFFVLLSGIWILLVGRMVRSSTGFLSWSIIFILVNVIVCPVCLDISPYVPIVNYIRYAMPLGWYLGL